MKQLQREIQNHKLTYILLGLILIFSFILRVYRVDEILGFYFDQGRDANVIWDLWHNGELFLIGPTTGIAGIFRGPFYYYLIAPAYLIGNGNPVFPAIFLAMLSILALVIMYIIGMKLVSRTAGLIAAALGAFSYSIIYASRWLSNPTPMLLLSVLLIWQMVELVGEKKRTRKTDVLWMGIAFTSGLSLFHFGSSGEFFYFFALALFAVWQRKKLPSGRALLGTIGAFFVTVLPLILFDFIHDQILSNNIRNFISNDDTFRASFGEIIQNRLTLYSGAFLQKVFPSFQTIHYFLFAVLGVALIAFLRKGHADKKLFVIPLMLAAPIIGFLFFQGNEGNVYDYYFTGYYLIFILFVGILLGWLWKKMLGKLFVMVFLLLFLSLNWQVTKGYLSIQASGEQVIIFENQKQAIEWIYHDANGSTFNVDVYVPPVLPHAYDYLFRWFENMPEYEGNTLEQRPLLYTLYEVDPSHPERLRAWLDRQSGIGVVENEKTFGGITVQRRYRI